MAKNIEDYVPVVQSDSLNTAKDITTTGAVSAATVDGSTSVTVGDCVMTYVPTTHTLTFSEGTLSSVITLS